MSNNFSQYEPTSFDLPLLFDRNKFDPMANFDRLTILLLAIWAPCVLYTFVWHKPRAWTRLCAPNEPLESFKKTSMFLKLLLWTMWPSTHKWTPIGSFTSRGGRSTWSRPRRLR